jgi:predicted ATPase/DNA-binding CsgD family transcriptional regulator
MITRVRSTAITPHGSELTDQPAENYPVAVRAGSWSVIYSRRHELQDRSAARLVTPGLPLSEASGIPVSPAPLVGRQREVAAVGALLRQPAVRLVTITGPGGVGKTRVALRAAESVAGNFSDGLYFIPFAALREVGIVPSVIARALGVREVRHRSLLDGIAAFCRDKEILLLLDNFEHVAEASSVIAELLGRCPRMKCLVTSRALLRVAGEHAFPVAPLPLPPAGAQSTLEQAEVSPALQLFVARAQAVDPAFALTESNISAVETICRRLDSLPLAIELAAAKLRHLSPAELAGRLEAENRGTALRELADGPRDTPARQQTLSGAIGWSYDLLGAAEQAAFRRLGVFVGGFTIDAAEAIANTTGDAAINVREAVAYLVDQSLLQRHDAPGGGSRYGMLETVRGFALEKLAATGEEDAIQAAHASYFATIAEWAAPQISTEHQQECLDRLQAELPNFRAVLSRLEQRHDIARALRLAAALWRFWHRRGYWEEGRRWLDRLLGLAALHDDVDQETLAAALTGAGWLVHHQGDFAAARVALDDGLARYRLLGRNDGQVDALHGHAMVSQSLGENARAAKFGEEALSLARLSGDHIRIAESLCYLSRATRELGDYARARALADEALALHRATRNRGGTAVALLALGDVARDLGETSDARVWAEESLAIFRELAEPLGEGFSLHNLAVAAYNQGDSSLALVRCRESLAIFRRLDVGNAVAEVLASQGAILAGAGDARAALAAFTEALPLALRVGPRWVVAAVLEGIARVAVDQGQHLLAAELAGGSTALRAAIGVPVRPNWRASLEATLAAARDALDLQAFTAAWGRGQKLPLAQIVATARNVTVSSARPPATALSLDHLVPPCGLSPRELEVVHLLVAGKTDRQIGEELFISPRTVSKHVGAILLKLAVGSRAEAAVHAIRHRLT